MPVQLDEQLPLPHFEDRLWDELAALHSRGGSGTGSGTFRARAGARAPRESRSGRRREWLMASAAAATALLVGAVALFTGGDDSDDVRTVPGGEVPATTEPPPVCPATTASEPGGTTTVPGGTTTTVPGGTTTVPGGTTTVPGVTTTVPGVTTTVPNPTTTVPGATTTTTVPAGTSTLSGATAMVPGAATSNRSGATSTVPVSPTTTEPGSAEPPTAGEEDCADDESAAPSDPVPGPAMIVFTEQINVSGGIDHMWNDEETGLFRSLQLDAEGNPLYDSGWLSIEPTEDGGATILQRSVDYATATYTEDNWTPPGPLPDDWRQDDEIESRLAAGSHVADGTEVIDGRELLRFVDALDGVADPELGVTWYDPETRRAVRRLGYPGSDAEYTQTYEYLERTPENLAFFDVPIPEGFIPTSP